MATEVVVIVDTDGTGDYSSLSAAESGEQKDLVTADEQLTIKCQASSGSADTASLYINGFTTDATRFVRVTTDESLTGSVHAGVFPSSSYRLIAANSSDSVLTLFDPYTEVIGIAAHNTATGAGFDGAFQIGEPNCLLDSCIATTDLNDGSAIGISFGETGCVVQNCLAYESGGPGFWINAPATLINCTSVDNGGDGYDLNGRASTVKNCIGSGNTGSDFGELSSATITYCVSSDATLSGVGSNNQSSVSVTFVDAANDDYHLDPSDTVAKDAGIGPSSDADVPDHDFEGDARSGTTTDIGADQTATQIIGTDALTLSFSEQATKLRTYLELTDTDNIALSLSEAVQVAIQLFKTDADNLSFSLAETDSLAVTLWKSDTDTISLSVAETDLKRVFNANGEFIVEDTDSLTLSLQEDDLLRLFTAGGALIVDDTDDLSFALDEAVQRDVLRFKSDTDNILVALLENQNAFKGSGYQKLIIKKE